MASIKEIKETDTLYQSRLDINQNFQSTNEELVDLKALVDPVTAQAELDKLETKSLIVKDPEANKTELSLDQTKGKFNVPVELDQQVEFKGKIIKKHAYKNTESPNENVQVNTLEVNTLTVNNDLNLVPSAEGKIGDQLTLVNISSNEIDITSRDRNDNTSNYLKLENDNEHIKLAKTGATVTLQYLPATAEGGNEMFFIVGGHNYQTE